MRNFSIAAVVLILGFVLMLGLAPDTLMQFRPAFRSAKTELERQLKDPASVQYRNISIYDDGTVCGEFNSRNGFGAYTGFEEFMVKDGTAYVDQPEILSPDGCLKVGVFDKASMERMQNRLKRIESGL